MAAIAGIMGANPDRTLVNSMLAALQHRGPDTLRLHEQSSLCAGVGASTLSEARGDGFATSDGIAVLLDGDLYNARQDGQSDADVALDAFRKYGRSFASHLDGVFACAVQNGEELILARDSVGVRPLYFGKTSTGETCFASELKALRGTASEVSELLPATTYSSEHGMADYVPSLPPVRVPEAVDQAILALRRCVTEAVARRTEDGAVGAFLLSGGLDSSIIACVAGEIGLKIPAITVGMDGAPDLENAKLVAEHLGVEHIVRLYTADEIEALVPNAVFALESFDEDCVSGAISNLFASAEASKITNCILSGEGGDELFGGYHLLKELKTDTERLQMMQRLIAIAYNTAVQRLDRSMFGNSINYRTPFIDGEVIAFASQIPVSWKIHDVDGELIEKWILREAFKDLLPEKIYKRRKLRFSGGTGTDGVMDTIAEDKLLSGEHAPDTKHSAAGYTLNSQKEIWYYRLFKKQFPAPCFERLVGRWDPGK